MVLLLRNAFKEKLAITTMKQFVSGLVLGIGIGLLVCGFLASSLLGDFEYTLNKYDREIDDFYEFTHSYGFQALQGLVSQVMNFYKANPLARQALETVGMGQVGQLLQDVDENLQETVDISEELSRVKESVREARSQILYLEIGGIALIGIGVAVGIWAFYRQ